MSPSEASRPGPESQEWGTALITGAIVVVLCWAGFLFIPDRLLVYLATRVSPHPRDLLVSLWVVAFFVALSWGFVRLQRGRRR